MLNKSLFQKIQTKYKLFELTATHHYTDGKKLKGLAKELASLLEEYANSIPINYVGKFVVLDDTTLSYDALIPTLIYITLYTNKDEENTTAMSYTTMAEKIGLGEKVIKTRIKLLIQLNFIKKVGRTSTNVNRYHFIKSYPRLDKISPYAIIANINELQEEIDKTYLEVLKTITNEISTKIQPQIKESRIAVHGLIPVGGILIPHTILRTVLVFTALYTFKGKDNTISANIGLIRGLIGIHQGTLKKEFRTLIDKKWIGSAEDKGIYTFKVLKACSELDRVPKDEIILNIKDFQRIPINPEYAKALITICEGLTGILFSKISKKEGK